MKVKIRLFSLKIKIYFVYIIGEINIVKLIEFVYFEKLEQ